MGAGHQRWWLSGSLESRRHEYTIRNRARQLTPSVMPKLDGIQFIIDERLGPGEVYLLQCRDFIRMFNVGQTKEGNVAAVNEGEAIVWNVYGIGEVRIWADARLTWGQVEFRYGQRVRRYANTEIRDFTLDKLKKALVDMVAATGAEDPEVYLPADAYDHVRRKLKQMMVAFGSSGPETTTIGTRFVDAMQKLMNGAGAYSDDQFEARVDELLDLEERMQRTQCDNCGDRPSRVSCGDTELGWFCSGDCYAAFKARKDHETHVTAHVKLQEKLGLIKELKAQGHLDPASVMKVIESAIPGDSITVGGVRLVATTPADQTKFADMYRDAGDGRLDWIGTKVLDRDLVPPLTSDRRIGAQLRCCYVCGKEQPVDDYNLCIEPMVSVGEYGDDEDLYVCDADAADVLKAVRRVKDNRVHQAVEVDPIDLLADDE